MAKTGSPQISGTSVYVDGTNLHKGIRELGWELDYKRFYVWLKEKYKSQSVYMFLGHIPKHEPLYNHLTDMGYDLIFKEVTTHKGIPKGNCDAEMVLHAVKDVYEKKASQVILVTGDGDFACLVDFLVEKKCLNRILVPNRNYCSYLLRKRNVPLVFLDSSRLQPRLQRKDP
jgi:uncharacterized LabA/DUF88 family protein